MSIPGKRLAVRRVLMAARRRYHSLPRLERPALHCPTSLVGLFTMRDLITLAQNSYYPLPAEAVAWIGRPPRRDRYRRFKTWLRAWLVKTLPQVLHP